MLNSMEQIFKDRNILLRAVCPKKRMPFFWKPDGTLSSAAFKKKDGLSVTCTNITDLAKSLVFMVEKYTGKIVSVTAQDCESVNAVLLYLPSKTNKYHSEIHGSKEQKQLSEYQAKMLVKRAIIQSQGREE